MSLSSRKSENGCDKMENRPDPPLLSSDTANMSTEEEVKNVHVKLNTPQGRSLEFTVQATDTIYEIRQILKDIPSTQTFTSYDLTHSGEKLEISATLEDIMTAGDTNADKISMDLIPLAYTELSAREHVNIVRKLSALDTSTVALTQIIGQGHGASSWDALQLDELKKVEESSDSEETPAEGDEEKDDKKTKVELSDDEKVIAANIIKEILSIDESSLGPFDSKKTEYLKPALKSLALSSWNPVNTSRRVYGDLFYLSIKTLEGEILNVTANVTGFYVNNSSENKFDPSMKISGKSNKDFSLLDLLVSISPKFSEQLLENDQVQGEVAPELYINPPSTLLSNPWLVTPSVPVSDLSRSQTFYFEGGFDGADIVKDWNKEYQTAKDVVIENSNQLAKDQLYIQTSSGFNIAAIQGALAVARGEIEPLNPDESPDLWMYLRNGIFYCKPIDSLGHHATSGPEGPRVAATRDVAAVRLMNKYDLNDVHCLLTTVVDYCGQRIICQAPVPGIFTDPADETVNEVTPKYGYTDGQSALLTEESIAESFKVIGEAFGIKPHKVWTEDGETIIESYTSGFTNGIIGSDGKKYAIDLFRTTPLDIEFIEKHVDFSKADSYPHREVSLRREAINEWVRRETAVAIKKHTETLEKEDSSSTEKQTIGIDPTLFALNPDAFSLPKAPNAELAAQLESDEADVRNVSEFLNKVLIPEFIDEQANAENQNPIDGFQLTDTFHSRGINMRYLGEIAKLSLEKKNEFLQSVKEKEEEIAKVNAVQFEKEEARIKATKEKLEARYKAQLEAKEKGEPIPTFEDEKDEDEELELSEELSSIPTGALLDVIYTLSIEEMIARGTKHYLRKSLETIPLMLATNVISHTMNLLLASKANPTPNVSEIDPTLLALYPRMNLASLKATKSDLQKSIEEEVFNRFRFQLPENWVDSIRPLSLWRNISVKFGIQWINKPYAFTSSALNDQIETQTTQLEKAVSIDKTKKKGKKQPIVPKMEVQTTTFVPADIVSIVPIVKDSVYDSSLLPRIWANIVNSTNETTSTAELFPHLSELMNYVEQLYGPVHRTTALYMSRISNVLASIPEGDLFARKAFQIFERYCGGDSYQAAMSLNQLISTEISHDAPVNAFKLLKRSISQWTLANGECHPTVITGLNNVFIVALNYGLNVECIDILKRIITLSDKAYGPESTDSSIFKYRLSQLMVQLGKEQEGVLYAKDGYKGLLKSLGLLNKNTVDARKWATTLENYIIHKKNTAKRDAEAAVKGRKEQASALSAKADNVNSKKFKAITPDPELAAKSVDDILAFINGPNVPSKKSKKKHSKK